MKDNYAFSFFKLFASTRDTANALRASLTPFLSCWKVSLGENGENCFVNLKVGSLEFETSILSTWPTNHYFYSYCYNSLCFIIWNTKCFINKQNTDLSHSPGHHLIWHIKNSSFKNHESKQIKSVASGLLYSAQATERKLCSIESR